MAEFSGGEEKIIRENEPIVFENKTDSSFDVGMGVVFRKSGIYDVSIVGNKTIVSEVSGLVNKGKWIVSHIPDSMLWECNQCGFDCGAHSFNFCPNCGADMRGENR